MDFSELEHLYYKCINLVRSLIDNEEIPFHINNTIINNYSCAE